MRHEEVFRRFNERNLLDNVTRGSGKYIAATCVMKCTQLMKRVFISLNVFSFSNMFYFNYSRHFPNWMDQYKSFPRGVAAIVENSLQIRTPGTRTLDPIIPKVDRSRRCRGSNRVHQYAECPAEKSRFLLLSSARLTADRAAVAKVNNYSTLQMMAGVE